MQKRLSFIVIPNSSDKTFQTSVSAWVPSLVLSFLILLMLATLVSTRQWLAVGKDLQTAKKTIAQLTLENKNKDEEIMYFKNRSLKIEEELMALRDLESRVLSLVGLDSKAEQKESETLFLVSRSAQRSGLFWEEDEIDLLEELIERQKESMEKLLMDVEKQLEYMDALPNLRPLAGQISSPFGYRISPIHRRREFHQGIDIVGKTGTDIVAAGSGLVTFSGYNGGYGRMIVISHGYGYQTVYAHNSKNLVEVGQQVQKGEVIAKVGSTGLTTGPHLHFEIRKEGKAINPLTLLQE